MNRKISLVIQTGVNKVIYAKNHELTWNRDGEKNCPRSVINGSICIINATFLQSMPNHLRTGIPVAKTIVIGNENSLPLNSNCRMANNLLEAIVLIETLDAAMPCYFIADPKMYEELEACKYFLPLFNEVLLVEIGTFPERGIKFKEKKHFFGWYKNSFYEKTERGRTVIKCYRLTP